MKLSLRSQLLIAFIVIIAGSAVISAISYYTMINTRDTLIHVFESDFLPYQKMANVKSEFVQWIRQFDRMVETPQDLPEHERGATEFRVEIQGLITETLDLQLTQTGRSILESINEDIETIVVLRAQLISAIQQQQPEFIEQTYSEIISLAGQIENTQNVYHVSTRGRKVIEETIGSMNDIQDVMKQVAQSIMNLNEQSQMVGQITDSVNDLADATNILSVNASIEAAKAGEQGKGFSVVAQEIRSLAIRSKQATTNIRQILSDIQKATSTSVLITEQAGKKVDSGVQQSFQAKEAIEVLSNNITEAAQAATQIAASSSQQLAGMDQMAEGMSSINQATQQNVSSLKELESAMRNLSELGERLNSVVNIL
ncbi:type IV pilus biogenesis protein PilJ [Chitinispirillum alkaliphilum]|nr:type IV pilus biogenesis protein PilJ [Chitinispirillum alkaliphilum]